MIRMIFTVSIALLFSVFCFSQTSYKKVNLYNKAISLDVPEKWRIKENAMAFSAYEIKYDLSVKDPKSNSGVSLYIFDSLYGPQGPVTDSIVDIRKSALLSDPVMKIVLEESGTKIVSGLRIGYLKYTYRVNNKFKRSYGVDIFFCNSKRIYYKLQILGIKESPKVFKPVANKVFESLCINSF